MMYDAKVSTSRRTYLVGAIYGLTSLIATALSIPALVYLFHPRRGAVRTGWVDAGELVQIEPGSPREVTFRSNRVDGWKIHSEKASAWIVKGGDGTITAFSPWCTHLGCAYHWERARRAFACPCHGSWFSITGKVITGPASRPLDRYETKLEGTRIWIKPVRQARGV